MNDTIEKPNEKPKRRLWLWVILLAIGVPVGVTASWVSTEYMLEQTSGEEFCAGCHSMGAVAAAYRASKHGGKQGLGIKAKCADCHLPHDSHLGYLVAKARTGFHDGWVELTGEPEKNDWHANRHRRAEYVYDSGCLKCHAGKQVNTDPSHPTYFAGGTNPFNSAEKYRCVDCHRSVGHKDLAKHLDAGSDT